MVTWKEPSRLRSGDIRRKFSASRSRERAGVGALCVADVGGTACCSCRVAEFGLVLFWSVQPGVTHPSRRKLWIAASRGNLNETIEYHLAAEWTSLSGGGQSSRGL